MAAEAGADLLGFVFYPPSPRSVHPRVAHVIVQELRAARFPNLTLVAVTVNPPRPFQQRLLTEVGVDLIQLHGEEPPAIVADLNGRAYKALRPRSAEEADIDIPWYLELGPSQGPGLLLDAAVEGAYGGTGRHADWEIARRWRQATKLLLAGGLTPDNVAQAVRIVQPWGVDVSSGVEISPGRKDPYKVRDFIAAARAALQEVAP